METSDPSLPSLPDIRLACRETYTRRPYFWDNRIRTAYNSFVIQRTVRGSCGFSVGSTQREVPPEHAMLFRHGENSSYGLGPKSSLPYETEYVIIDPRGGILKLFEGLRAHYGPVLRMETGGEAQQILLQLILEFDTGRPSDRLTHAEASYQLLLKLYREQGRNDRHGDPVAYGRHLLETRYREAKNLKEWCADIGISREHFSREFTARYQESPANFLRRLRLQHAHSLIRISSHLSLEDIAAISGFASVQTFHRAYKRYYKIPASRARA